MLELRVGGIAESEGRPQEREPLVRRIMEDARGWIDAIIMSVNGARIALATNDEVSVNKVADAACIMADATLAVIELLGSRKFRELDLRVQGGRHLIIRCYKGCYLAVLTKPNPNLGLIKLALDRNLALEKSAEKVAAIAEKIFMRARIK